MELIIECNSNLNKSNYYERKLQIALENISKYVHFVNESCIDAVDCIQKAIKFLEAAKDELEDGMDDERQLYDLRLANLQRHLDSMMPYRFREQLPSNHRSRLPSVTSFNENASQRLETARPTYLSTACSYAGEEWITLKKMTPVDNSAIASAMTPIFSKCPNCNDRQLEEKFVRMEDHQQRINFLVEKLKLAEKCAAEEQRRRLTAEAELLACQPGSFGDPLTDSMYNTDSSCSKIQSFNTSLSSSISNDSPSCLAFGTKVHDEALMPTPS